MRVAAIAPGGRTVMARSRKGPKATPQRATPAERAAAVIRGFHELGRRVQVLAAEPDSDVTTVARTLEDEEGISFDRCKKAARFAEEFTDRELDRLCAFCLTPGNYPLSVNHIRFVLGVADRATRMRLLKQAAEGGWTAGRLDQKVRALTGEKSGSGGPRLAPPGDLMDALEQVIKHSDEWLKRHDGIWSRDSAWPPVVGLGTAAPEDLRVRLQEARERVKRLREGAAKLEERLGAVDREVRRAGRKDRGKVV